jgi:hypothetical protein
MLEGIYPFLNLICTNASKKAAQYYNRQHASLQSISNTTKALIYYINKLHLQWKITWQQTLNLILKKYFKNINVSLSIKNI